MTIAQLLLLLVAALERTAQNYVKDVAAGVALYPGDAGDFGPDRRPDIGRIRIADYTNVLRIKIKVFDHPADHHTAWFAVKEISGIINSLDDIRIKLGLHAKEPLAKHIVREQDKPHAVLSGCIDIFNHVLLDDDAVMRRDSAIDIQADNLDTSSPPRSKVDVKNRISDFDNGLKYCHTSED